MTATATTPASLFQVVAGQRRHFAWPWLPLLLVTIVYLGIALDETWRHLREPWPLTPWESAITVDAWRINHAQPVYADPATGHATHMYGPLVTLAAAVGERMFGVDVRVPRTISLAACVALSLLAGWLLSAGRSRCAVFLIGTLTFLQFFRVYEWSTEARPDAASLLFGFLAVALFYRAAGAARIAAALACTLTGTALLLIGFFFKQPAVVLAVIPPIAFFADRRHRRGGNWRIRAAISLIPGGAAVVTLGILWLTTPWLFFYMVRVPASYPVIFQTWEKAWRELGRFDLLFLLAAALWVVLRLGKDAVGKVVSIDVWLLIAIVVTDLFGASARAKVGGGFNSLLPAIVAMNALTIRSLDAWWALPARSGLRRSAMVLSVVAAPLLLLLDISALLGTGLPRASSQLVTHGDRYYARVIESASRLPGRVMSLDDPTIALLAKGYAGRSGDCELDASGRGETVGNAHPTLFNEIGSFDWVIQVKASRRPVIDDATLKKLGFERAAWNVPAEAAYVLWHRSAIHSSFS